MDFLHEFLVMIGLGEGVALLWLMYLSQRALKAQDANHLISVRILDRIERMTERLVVQSADKNVGH